MFGGTPATRICPQPEVLGGLTGVGDGMLFLVGWVLAPEVLGTGSGSVVDAAAFIAINGAVTSRGTQDGFRSCCPIPRFLR